MLLRPLQSADVEREDLLQLVPNAGRQPGRRRGGVYVVAAVGRGTFAGETGRSRRPARETGVVRRRVDDGAANVCRQNGRLDGQAGRLLEELAQASQLDLQHTHTTHTHTHTHTHTLTFPFFSSECFDFLNMHFMYRTLLSVY